MPELTSVPSTLRHVLVALADRFEHAVADAPAGFAAFDAGAGVRTPLELVRHVAGLMRFADALWTGREAGPIEPLGWAEALDAVRLELRSLDRTFLRHPLPIGEVPAHRVLQGPLLDAVTHVGQLLTLRRLAGAPVGRRRYAAEAMRELDAV